MLKFIISNLEKHSIISRNYAVTYYLSREEVPWLLRNTENDKKLKNDNHLHTSSKNCEN